MPDASTSRPSHVTASSKGSGTSASGTRRRFHSLAHVLDVSALEAADRSIRKDAAVGVDGVTKDQYGQDLERNLQDLYERLRSKRYRHQPIRRVHIPKDGGRTRPIGISALEDKVVQGAVRHGVGSHLRAGLS